jgi:hypothetical protein
MTCVQHKKTACVLCQFLLAVRLRVGQESGESRDHAPGEAGTFISFHRLELRLPFVPYDLAFGRYRWPLVQRPTLHR